MKKSILYILCLGILVIMTGCTSSGAETEAPEPTLEQRSLTEFAVMLQTQETPENIEAYINDIKNQIDVAYTQAMVKAYADYLEDRIPDPTDKLAMQHFEYDRVLQFADYLDDEYVDYLLLYRSESYTDSLNRPIDEVTGLLLEEAAEAEAHLLRFPDGETQGRIYELYVRYLYAAVLNNGNAIQFADHPQVLEAMRQFVDTHPDDRTAAFINHFLTQLDSCDGVMETEPMQQFYFDFYSLLRQYLWNEQAPQS